MQDDLIGYLLDALEAEEQKLVETLLFSDLELRRQLEVLRLGVEIVVEDCGDVTVPAELSVRTCRLVREVTDGSGNPSIS